ncbi:MAG: peptide ABC transporter substrate-binding protein [Phycisphaerae bacterium]
MLDGWKRHVLIGAILVLPVWGIFWAGGTSLTADRADFTYVNNSGIHTLDPARMSWTTDFRVALNIWEGVTTWDSETLEPIGGAAYFPPQTSNDGREVTFTIRDDARWSNGDPVVPDDFIRGLRRGLEPGTAGDYAFLVTEHLEGAADYHDWRLHEVTILTALARLADGWQISSKQARALHAAEIAAIESVMGEESPPLVSHVPVGGEKGQPTESDDDAWWENWGRELLSCANTDRGVDFSALHRERLHAHASELESRFRTVGIRKSGDRSLTYVLRSPCPYFLDITGFPVFLPCHESIEQCRQAFGGSGLTREGLVVYDPVWTKPVSGRGGYKGLVTNGPYEVDAWSFKRRLRLRQNRFYHSRLDDMCDTIDMVVFDHLNAALMAYDAGEIDFLPDLGVPFEHELLKLALSGQRPDIRLAPLHATYFLNFNCQRTFDGRPNPFSDPRVRRAFTMALDRDTLVDHVLATGDEVASTLVPPSMTDAYQPPEGISYDPMEAAALLSSVGFPDGAGFPVVDFLYPPNDEIVCQAIAGMWERTLGVRVRLHAMESKTFAQKRASHEFMVARGNWFADYRDPTTFLDCFRIGNGNNDSAYVGEAYDMLLDQASASSSAANRFRLLSKAEQLLVEEDCPILPIWHYRMPVAIRPGIDGITANARLWVPFHRIRVASPPVADTGGA